jgi:hypothetical protein
MDWIFLISSLNFSFWSEHEGTPDRYGVEWREGWEVDETIVHTGYWSLVAAIDRGKSKFTEALIQCLLILHSNGGGDSIHRSVVLCF